MRRRNNGVQVGTARLLDVTHSKVVHPGACHLCNRVENLLEHRGSARPLRPEVVRALLVGLGLNAGGVHERHDLGVHGHDGGFDTRRMSTELVKAGELGSAAALAVSCTLHGLRHPPMTGWPTHDSCATTVSALQCK